MKFLRWIIGLLIIAAFLFINFFILEAELMIKLINVILFCSLFVVIRVILGPSPADRIVAVEILGVLIIGLLALLGIFYEESFFMDVGLIWALLSFIASLAFAKILEGRKIND